MTINVIKDNEAQVFFNQSASALFCISLDENLSFKFVNSALIELLGINSLEEFREFTKDSFINIVREDYRDMLLQSINDGVLGNKSTTSHYRLNRPDGHDVVVLHVNSRPFTSGADEFLFVNLIDVSDILYEFEARESNYKKLAERDGMTGLYNREAAKTKIDALLDSSEAPFSLFLIDIDDFKYVNDNFGHPVGDKVLISLGDYLRNCFRSDDIVARIGGDEFLVFAKGLGNQEPMARIIDKLSRGPFVRERKSDVIDESLRQASYIPSISVGVITINDNDTSFNELYSAADDLLYDAKHEGKHRIKYKEL